MKEYTNAELYKMFREQTKYIKFLEFLTSLGY